MRTKVPGFLISTVLLCHGAGLKQSTVTTEVSFERRSPRFKHNANSVQTLPGHRQRFVWLLIIGGETENEHRGCSFSGRGVNVY